MKRRIILAGGSGFLGGVLAKYFRALDWEVIELTRRARVRGDGVKEVAWDGKALGNWEDFVDGAEAVVLGCAGMADLAAALTTEHGLPVVDGVAASIPLAEGLVRLGLRTSKVGAYAAPGAKAYDKVPRRPRVHPDSVSLSA